MPRRLKPSMREHKRYLSYEVISRGTLASNMHHVLANHMKNTLGIFDAAAAGIVPVTFDQRTNQGIIRVSAGMVEKAKVALLLAGPELSEKAFVRILRVSGTIKQVKEKKGG